MALNLTHYRFGINELAESTHGWHAAIDTDPASGVIALDTTFLLRFTMQDVTTAVSNIDAEFQYRKNGGTWTQITTSTTNVKAVTPSCWANAAATTKRLTGTGTFETSSAGCTADGISGGTAFDIVANGNGETECALQLVSANLAGGDLIEFRLTRDGGVLLTTYNVVPSITVPAAPAAYSIVGAITVAIAVAAAVLDFTRHAFLVGALTVAATPAATMQYTPAPAQYAIVGAVTTTATPAATLSHERHFSIAGAATVAVTPAATLDYQRHAGLVGSVTVSTTPNSTTDFTRRAALAGAITVQATPAATLDYQRHASLSGQVAVSATPSASLDFTRHGGIVGAVTTVATPAATLLYTPASAGFSIVGNAIVSATPSAAFDFTRHAGLTGAVTTTVTPAATLLYTSDTAAIVGSVTVEITPAAALSFQRHARLNGEVAVVFVPAAEMLYTSSSAPSIPRAIAVSAAVVGLVARVTGTVAIPYKA